MLVKSEVSMNIPNQSSPGPGQSSSVSSIKAVRSRNPLVRIIVTLLLSFVLAVTVYSIYVAVHEPDPQETVVLGQTKIASGSPAALRVLVRNRVSGRPAKGATVALSLSGKAAAPIKLGTFHTDADGSLSDAINIPEIPAGEYQLIVDVASSLGRDHVVKKVEVQHPVRLLLSSDKPVYQPGQTIHLRSLMINGRTQKPSAGEPVTFEVSDPKGNKVFKENRKASAFGIASADFVLASELNLGRYAIRAIAGAITAECTVEVRPYVLPKFKIQITTDKPYYLPGQTVSGSVQADYFFGKPAGGATVKLTAATFEEKPVDIAVLHGRTDAAGHYPFQFVLPDFFAGMPQKNGQAFLDLTAEVCDSAQHTEQKTLSLSVAQNELEITVLPEAGVLVPGVENLVYVLTTYPDGRPAVCRVFLNGIAYQGDAQGVCIIRITPADASQQLELQALDSAGRKAQLSYRPDNPKDVPPLLVRTDKAVYQAGQTAQVTLLSPEKNTTVFLDVIKDGQTVLTRSVPLSNHKSQYALSLPASLVGALQINAYVITEAGEDRGCSRLIYVNPASALQIATKMSKPVYRPGEVARLDFSVTDAQGRPAPAALGIAAVDESVFALSENRPGLLRQFLEVEGELLKPRYQIKSFSSPEQLLFDTGDDQALAQAYFSSLGQKQPANLGLDGLISGQYISPQILEHIRSMRGTPAYESLRRDPQYAEIFRLLENGNGIYNLREATGLVKLQSVEAHRKAYFKKLTTVTKLGFLGLLFLLPIFLLIHYARPGIGIFPNARAIGQDRKYVEIASSTYHLLGALVLCPFLFYPLGGYFCDQWNIDNPGWVLLGLEAAVVVITLVLQFIRISLAASDRMEKEMAPLRMFMGAFLGQFILSRLGFVVFSLHLVDFEEWFALFWVLGSVVAPLIVLGGLNGHIRRQMTAKGIPPPEVKITLVGILIIISIIAILAALLLPALSAAKSKGMRVSLMSDLKQIDLAKRMAEEDGIKPGSSSVPSSPRVRRDFPETLFWRPELITDDHGRASLEIPLADSITTWRASVDGISAAGKMGSVEMPITVFQDFFVDLDLPVSMSLGDQISVPVTCYNYLKEPQDIHLHLAGADWFESATPDSVVHLEPGAVKSMGFPIKVLRVGGHALRVTARGTRVADAIEREIRVLPTGDKMEHLKNEVLKDAFADTFSIPAGAIPGSENLWLKCYPSRFSEVVEGLESIFQAPYGCFEQTSSTTYPNVLVLDYMKRTGRLTPEIEIKARKFINAGYQRLLTFEVPGGGFEWFGHAPAHVGLTAYGITEFTDMSRVHPVDQAMLDRTIQWLFSVQNSNGSWNQADGLDSWSGNSPVTAYVAWALAESGDQSPNLDRALNYLRSHPQTISSLYEKALAANAFLAWNRNDSFGHELVNQLKEAALIETNRTIHWPSTGYSMTYSHGSGMDVETTALSVMAMIKANAWPESVKQALTWLSKHKTGDGTWGSTQATILAMRALIQGTSASLGQEFESTVTVRLNGEKIETFHINQDNSDVMKQVDLTGHLQAGDNRLELHQSPVGELPIQITGAYWLPARSSVATIVPRQTDLLQINLQYDRATLAVNDQLKCAVTVKNHTGRGINMAIVDLGIPPGFDVDAAAFEAMQEQGRIAKFEVTGNQVILYLRELSGTTPFRFEYALRAKYPLRVQTPASAVYEYYQPQNQAQSTPEILQVVDR
jgi:uncharacterized protein YfaS (alpha-2-macroglobulin family)